MSFRLRWLSFLIPAVLAAFFSFFRVFDAYELETYDWRARFRGPRPVSADIVLVEIADDTLKKIGEWPFDRGFHANLIDILKEAGAKAVLFDMLFVEPHPSDSFVAEAAKRAGNVYFCEAFREPVSVAGNIYSKKVLAPLIGAYADAAKGVGFANSKADADGKRRRVPLVIRFEDRPHFHLSFAAALDALGIPKDSVRIRPGRLETSKGLSIPLDDEGYPIVSYAGKWKETFLHVSYVDILTSYLAMQARQKPPVDLSRLKDKICIVGYTATASHDTNPIPLEPIYPQVGTHANVLNNILQKDFILRLGRLPNLVITMILAAWVLLTSLRLRPLRGLVRSLLILAVFLAGTLFVFVRWGVWADLFYPMALSVVLYAAATLTRTLLEIRKRELIENELKIASQIQQSFLPAELPKETGLQVAVYMKPAKAVGGDLYSFVKLGEGRLGVMIGDVSGKGTPAALFMAKTVSEFKFSARAKADPSSAMKALNESIVSESTGGLFVTLTYAIFHVPERRFVLSNAGHLPVLFSSRESTRFLEAPEGMPIGVSEETGFSNLERTFSDDDCFLFYSDGVTEARNRKGQEYGTASLERILLSHRGQAAERILAELVKNLQSFIGKAEPHDDITLILVRSTGQ